MSARSRRADKGARRRLGLPVLLLLLLCTQFAGSGCGTEDDESFSTELPLHIRVHQPLGVGSVEVSRITLLVSVATTDPVSGLPTPGSTLFARDLVPNGTTWTSRLELAAGSYFIRAEAFAGTDSVASTPALPVTIDAASSPVVDLVLHVSGKDDSITNHAPVFDFIQVSTAWAQPREVVVITVIGSDADGDLLTLSSTLLGCTPAGFGSIDPSPLPLTAGIAHQLHWTAPATAAECNLQLELRDDRGAASLAFVPLSVGPLRASLSASLTLRAAPVLMALTLQPGRTNPTTGITPVALAAAAVAGDGAAALAYSWSFDPAACSGNFMPAVGALTEFRLASFTGANAECALTVRVEDPDGGFVEGMLFLQRPPVVRYRPALWLEYQSTKQLKMNETLVLRVRSVAKNPSSYAWVAPVGSTIVNGADTSTMTWRATKGSAFCDPTAPTLNITVTVIDTVWNESSDPLAIPIVLHKNTCNQ